MNGTMTLGPVTLCGGQASFTKVFTVSGAKSLSAVYSGDANDTTSTATLTQVVN